MAKEALTYTAIGLAGSLGLAILMNLGSGRDESRRDQFVDPRHAQSCVFAADGKVVSVPCPTPEATPTPVRSFDTPDTPQSSPSEVFHPPSSAVHSVEPGSPEIDAALQAKKVGDEFEITHRDGTRYRVVKTGRDMVRVIEVIGEDKSRELFERKNIHRRDISAIQ